MKARVPGHFSDTRFATFSSIVLQKFLHNYKLYYHILANRHDKVWEKMNNASFLFSLCALVDVYNVIGSLSNALQKPAMAHWEIKSVYIKYIDKLHLMQNALADYESTINFEIFENCEYFTTLCKTFRCVKDTGEYEGCLVSVKEKVAHLTRGTTVQLNLVDSYDCVLRTSVKSVLQLVDKFETNFVNRLKVEDG